MRIWKEKQVWEFHRSFILMIYPETYQFHDDQNSAEFHRSWPKWQNLERKNDFLSFKFHEKLERTPSLRIPSKLQVLMIYPGTYQFPSDQNSTEFSLPKLESSCFTSQIQIIWIFKSTKINQNQPILLDTFPTHGRR